MKAPSNIKVRMISLKKNGGSDRLPLNKSHAIGELASILGLLGFAALPAKGAMACLHTDFGSI